MAQTPAEQKTAYPLPVYNYRVTVDEVTLSFSEVSGIQLEHDTVTYRHGLSFSEGERIQAFSFDSFFPISCERGVVMGAQPLFLHDWLRSREERGVEVSLCDETGTPVITWKIARALPVKLEAPTFDAASNDVAIERLELQVRGISLVEPEAETEPEDEDAVPA